MVEIIKMTAKEITFWTKHAVPAEPHLEHIPYMNLLRPISKSHWHLSDGDDEYII